MAWPYTDIQAESQNMAGIKGRVYPRICAYWQVHIKYQMGAKN